MLSYKDRVLGMLWGLHAGDSLGAPIEFLPPSKVWNQHTEMTGGGSFKWKPGEATDDTDLMLCVLRGIQSSGVYSFDILKKEMLAWLESKPPDIGTTTIRGLLNLKSGLPLRECGYVDDKFQGNGSLMRVAPMALMNNHVTGIYQGNQTLGLNAVLETQTKMTHGHHYCVEADRVLVAALKAALHGHSKGAVYHAALHEALHVSPFIMERLQKIPVTSWETLSTSGFCVDTLCAGLWAFLKYDNLEDALVAVVNRGDDSDSCGAVAGALCGAFYGPTAIPQRWLESLEYREEIKALCLALRL